MGGKGCDREGERRGGRGKEESGWEGSGKRINSSSTPLFFACNRFPTLLRKTRLRKRKQATLPKIYRSGRTERKEAGREKLLQHLQPSAI